MKVKEESEKVGLKLNIQKTKIMTSGPITSGQIDGETVETVASTFLTVWATREAHNNSSINFKSHELIHCSPITCIIAYIKYTLIKKKLYKGKKKYGSYED